MSHIPPPAAALLDLFAESLTDVRFGDVDAMTFARLANDVEDSAAVLATAQAALDQARAGLQERQDMLLAYAHRALAYARVYAEADDALRARLEAIALPRPARRPRAESAPPAGAPESEPARRPRGRPRKLAVAAPAQEVMALPAE